MDLDREMRQAVQSMFERQFRFLLHQVAGSEQAQLCPYCRRYTKGVYRRRMNTQYCDEESNWTVCCQECFEAIEAEWADQWAEYYSSVL